nr:FHA domain-containing protein FHA2 [Ipomoea batatas]
MFDLSSLGGGMNISRHHARIFYDFQRRRFALEVLGKNGCFVEGVLHLPGNPPVKLDSQDLLQIGDKEFYFLLPIRSILGMVSHHHHQHQQHLPPPSVNAYGAKKLRRGDGFDGSGYGYGSSGSGGKVAIDKKVDGRSRMDRDADNQQLLQLEEKDVVSSVANVLSDLCGPGEWMAMEKLHAELVEHFGNRWHHSRVRRYLTSEDYPTPEANAKPWYGLLMLLRKYPEHFVINTRSKGRVALEFVSLVSLLS